MRPKLLSSRLFIVAAVALAPAIAITVTSVITIQRDRTEDLYADALITAELVAMEVEQTVSGVDGVLRTVAAAPVVRGADEARCSALLTETSATIRFIAAIHVVNDDGTIRCRSGIPHDDRMFAHDFFSRSLGTADLVTGTLAESGVGPSRLPLALRLGEAQRAPGGVAIAYLDLAWLQARLERLTLAPGNSLTIVDRSGTILARVPDPDTFVGTQIRPELHYLLDETVPGSLEVLSQDGTNRILGYIPPAATTSGLYVSAGYSTEQGYATTWSVARQALGLSLLGTAIATMLALYTARVFIARPVGTLIDTVSAWRGGNSAARTGMSPEQGEICSAGAALDAFMDEYLSNREARQKADEARELMRDELEHREKNLLATVQAIARQTFPQSGNEAAFRVFADRLNAISAANRLLKQSGWASSPLRGLIVNAVSTFIGNDLDRVTTRGPELVVKGNVATAIAMAIHELCTNAVKYGALGNDTGRVSVEWDVQPAEQGGAFTLVWTERGGPPVTKPEHTGFGSKVIKHALSAQTGGTVEIIHDPEGLICRLTAPAEAVLAQAAA